MSDRYMNKGQVTDVLSQRRFLATSARGRTPALKSRICSSGGSAGLQPCDKANKEWSALALVVMSVTLLVVL